MPKELLISCVNEMMIFKIEFQIEDSTKYQVLDI